MRRFILGLGLGVLIGSAGTAIAATIVGSDGYMIGWTVQKDGEAICDDPWVWTGTREIECD